MICTNGSSHHAIYNVWRHWRWTKVALGTFSLSSVVLWYLICTVIYALNTQRLNVVSCYVLTQLTWCRDCNQRRRSSLWIHLWLGYQSNKTWFHLEITVVEVFYTDACPAGPKPHSPQSRKIHISQHLTRRTSCHVLCFQNWSMKRLPQAAKKIQYKVYGEKGNGNWWSRLFCWLCQVSRMLFSRNSNRFQCKWHWEITEWYIPLAMAFSDSHLPFLSPGTIIQPFWTCTATWCT